VSDDKLNPYDLGDVARAQRERVQGGLRAARGILGPRPDDEEPPEVTIRRGRGDSDAELFDYMRRLWAEQKAEVARLTAELASAKETIRVFTRAVVRAERRWKEAHPDSAFYPDAPDLLAWVKEQVDKLAERRCETCLWWKATKADYGVCTREPNIPAAWHRTDFCSWYEPKEATDAGMV
jgi:hypothetical protein